MYAHRDTDDSFVTELEQVLSDLTAIRDKFLADHDEDHARDRIGFIRDDLDLLS